jgi:Zn-dependent M28 family amino/carboxypeptidase
MKTLKTILLLFTFILISGYSTACSTNREAQDFAEFNGESAYQDVKFQTSLGPRVPGSEAHERVGEWLVSELESNGWTANFQKERVQEHEIVNIIANRPKNEDLPWIIIGAHYDSRMYADRENLIENRNNAIAGANDGASGVSVLLELARVLPQNMKSNVWLVFFDAEDQGNLPSWEWIMGSSVFVESLDEQPDAVVVVDMVGDSDLNILIEQNSDQELAQDIWGVAADLGYGEQFLNHPKHRIVDDHLPFVQVGIPAVLIIDFDYPYWHTLGDTIDKISPHSLKVVGDVVLTWLYSIYD